MKFYESIIVILIIVLSLFSSCKKGDEKEAVVEKIKPMIETEPAGEDKCVVLTPAQRKEIKIKMAAASVEPLIRELELPGEIGPDPENVLHAAARFSGIAKKITKAIGDNVKNGDTLAVIENNENLSLYTVLASRSGTVIDKHIVPGEYVEAGRDLFVIADLSRIAVSIAIFGSDADIAVKGASARIMDLTGKRAASGVIDYVSPFHNEQTRSLTGRMLLPNTKGFWKPGALVRVRIQHKEAAPTLAVPNEAIQLVDGIPHVFIPETAVEYAAVPVTLGRKGAFKTEILNGLATGDSLVIEGAFELKAQFAVQAIGEGEVCSH
ncbi:MAG: efflux RND transporter periplasmic adaptor subunit [Fibrobacteres bacterium]|nr:efflux RND transporter periplasmic adaptor subunit [Fibrobacterota bacterium]